MAPRFTMKSPKAYVGPGNSRIWPCVNWPGATCSWLRVTMYTAPAEAPAERMAKAAIMAIIRRSPDAGAAAAGLGASFGGSFLAPAAGLVVLVAIVLPFCQRPV